MRRRLLRSIVLLGAAGIPLAVLPHAFDAFRFPKELALRAEAIILAAALLLAALHGERVSFRRDRWFLWPAAAMGWMVVTTLFSSNLRLSTITLLAAMATLIVYFVTVRVAALSKSPRLFVVVPLVIAALNAALGVVQELDLWMPFGRQSGVSHHQQCTAFIGNPNELGSYLAIAALTAAAAAHAFRDRRRFLVPLALFLACGVAFSQTLTAMIALVAGVVTLFAILSWRKTAVLALAIAALAVVVVLAASPLRRRAQYLEQTWRAHDYNALLSDRLTPFIAATRMAGDHLLVGTGPGTFGWNYFTSKLGVERDHPELRRAYSRGLSYGEAHNDHLQVLAEAGVPGSAIFLTLLVLLGSLSFRVIHGISRERFSVVLALPLAVCIAVLALAQFPLESTPVRMLIVHVAALCVAWRRR